MWTIEENIFKRNIKHVLIIEEKILERSINDGTMGESEKTLEKHSINAGRMWREDLWA